MKLIAVVALVLAFFAAAATTEVVAAETAESEAVNTVVKYVGTRMGSLGGHPATMLIVANRSGGGQFEMGIPNNKPDSPVRDPNTAAMNVIKELKANDLVKVHYVKTLQRKTLVTIEKHAPQPGDDDPEAVEFVKLAETSADGHREIVTRKGGKEQTQLVATKKSPDGKAVADEEVLAQARKLTEGDYVDVELTQADGKTFIRALHPYQPFRPAVYVKTGTVKSDANMMLVTVELKDGDKAVVLPIRPGASGTSDAALASKARAPRAGQTVIYKTTEEGGKTWLLDIRPSTGNQPMSDVTLNGTFESGGKTCPLKAVLKATGPGEWKATYYFDWGGKQEWPGTVKGNLQNGEVTGTAGSGGRTFGFKGQASGGVLTFEQFETTGGGHAAQGKGTLK